MTKLDILCELHAVIGARLFGEGPWLMEREDALKSNKRTLEMGLEEKAWKRHKIDVVGEGNRFRVAVDFYGEVGLSGRPDSSRGTRSHHEVRDRCARR